MKASVLINCAYGETRVAVLEDGSTAEIYLERLHDLGLVGNIYKGRVTRVLPGMEAAFVDIGLPRAAFLHVDDVWSAPRRPKEEEEDAEAPEVQRPAITKLLREGQEILVQVSKDPIGTKGARVTAHITLAGRHTVLMPKHHHVGISKRITDDAERERLRSIVESLRVEGEGFIVRTEGLGLEEEELREDMDFLRSLWGDIEKAAAPAPVSSLVQPDLDLVLRTTRDLFTRDVEELLIDDAAQADRVRDFLSKFSPGLVDRVRYHDAPVPLFDAHGVEAEIERALQREISLKSGGSIVIDHAEALTAIDINTGSFVGKQNLESTILRTNLEAAKEIVKQLRLRNIGGIIVIDFIDMESLENREIVFKAFSEALESDRARTHPLPISDLGVLEMTRKRVRESLGEGLTERCPYCNGLGRIRSRESICHEVFRELSRQGRSGQGADLVVGAHPEVAAMLAEDKSDVLSAIETDLGGTIVVQARRDFHQERYEILRKGGSSHA